VSKQEQPFLTPARVNAYGLCMFTEVIESSDLWDLVYGTERDQAERYSITKGSSDGVPKHQQRRTWSCPRVVKHTT